MKEFETSDYDLFIHELFHRTIIKKSILNNLFNLNLLNKIVHKQDELFTSFINSNNNFFIPKDLLIEKNYKKSIEYLYANYLDKSNFNIIRSNRSYISNKDNTIILCLNYPTYNFLKPQLLLFIKYVKQDLIPYNTDLLNNEEFQLLNQHILNIREKHFKKNNEPFLNNMFFLIFNIDIDLNDTIDNSIQQIDNQINIKYNEYINLTNILKEENKKFFERALLEEQMKTF